MSNPRRTNGARRTKLLRWLRAQGRPCWICGMPIDYGLPPGDPRAFECDEIVPVSRGGSPYDRANVDASHRCCNNWRKAKPAAVVRSIQAGVGRRGRPSCPEEFVAMAKAVERGDLQMRCSMPCKTTTEW